MAPLGVRTCLGRQRTKKTIHVLDSPENDQLSYHDFTALKRKLYIINIMVRYNNMVRYICQQNWRCEGCSLTLPLRYRATGKTWPHQMYHSVWPVLL